VGVAQHSQKLDDPRLARSPLELMEQVVRAAAEDAEAPGLLGAIDGIAVPRGLWRYGDPARLLAERLGVPAARTWLGALSGHIVQVLVDRACREIEAGRADVVAFVGGESEHSRRRLERRGLPVHWDDAIPGEPDLRLGRFDYQRMPEEERAGLTSATALFALCEHSLRRALGRTPAAHRDHLAALQAGMSRIARDQPNAWLRDPLPPDAIRDPRPGNRMVHHPYTKLMTSNIAVDQAAAFILCSTRTADRLGVPAAKRVHLRAATEMGFSTGLRERDVLHRHPGQVLAAQRALELAGLAPEDLDHVDAYACFPFAVQAGAAALGRGLDPLPSVTGGMTFFGGPLGSYVMHSKASMFERLRAEPGSVGVVGSLGGHFAHFGFGVYSTDPGGSPSPAIEDVSDALAALPRRRTEAGREGRATIETYTVEVGHDGPRQATIAALSDDGLRIFARSHDADLMAAVLADEELGGRPVRIKDGIAELG